MGFWGSIYAHYSIQADKSSNITTYASAACLLLTADSVKGTGIKGVPGK